MQISCQKFKKHKKKAPLHEGLKINLPHFLALKKILQEET